MTLKQRVESLEKLMPDDDAPGPLIFLKDGVYTRGADVITEEEYQALCQTCDDVFTVEVLYPPGVEFDD